MNVLKFCAVVMIAGTIGTVAADATGCRVVRSQVVVQEVIPIAVFQAIPVNVAAYSVGGGSDYSQAILEELRALRLEMQQLRQGQVNGAVKAEPAFVLLVRQNCAACHGVAPKGNKLSLFAPDGAWKEPTPELLGDLIAMVSSGRMPKDRKMSADDRLSLIAGLTSGPATAQKESLESPKKP